MNQARSHLSSRDSGGLARVCLAPAQTHSEAAAQCRNQGKTIAADLNGRPLSIANQAPCPTALHPVTIHSRSYPAAPRFSPTRFIPLAILWRYQAS